VEELFKKVDSDGSGMIEMNEFLVLVKVLVLVLVLVSVLGLMLGLEP